MSRWHCRLNIVVAAWWWIEVDHVTFASRTSFLTVRVETPLGGCVLIDSLSWSLPSILPSAHPIACSISLPEPRRSLRPLPLSLLRLSSGSVFHSVKIWSLF